MERCCEAPGGATDWSTVFEKSLLRRCRSLPVRALRRPAGAAAGYAIKSVCSDARRPRALSNRAPAGNASSISGACPRKFAGRLPGIARRNVKSLARASAQASSRDSIAAGCSSIRSVLRLATESYLLLKAQDFFLAHEHADRRWRDALGGDEHRAYSSSTRAPPHRRNGTCLQAVARAAREIYRAPRKRGRCARISPLLRGQTNVNDIFLHLSVYEKGLVAS